MKSKFAAFLLFATSLCYASVGDMKELLTSILNSGSDSDLPKLERYDSVFNRDTILALSASEVQEILPLIRRCLESPGLEVRRDGLMTAMAVSLRPDSSALLEPITDAVDGVASDPGSPLELGALYVLGGTNPHPSQKSVSYLQKHLEQANNSPQQLITIAVSLMRASAPGSPSWQEVLTVVDSQTDPGVKISVLQELGNERASDSSSEAFIQKSLEDPNPHIRITAIDSVSKLDANTRMNFVDRLTGIVSDPKESPEIRSKAKAALAAK